MESSVDIAKAEFNGAFDYLSRINQLLTACIMSSVRMDLNNWYHVLMQLFKELSTEMTPNQIRAINNELIKINSEHNLLNKKAIDPKLYLRLHNIELELRKVYNSSGLQMKRAEDPTKALR